MWIYKWIKNDKLACEKFYWNIDYKFVLLLMILFCFTNNINRVLIILIKIGSCDLSGNRCQLIVSLTWVHFVMFEYKHVHVLEYSVCWYSESIILSLSAPCTVIHLPLDVLQSIMHLKFSTNMNFYLLLTLWGPTAHIYTTTFESFQMLCILLLRHRTNAEDLFDIFNNPLLQTRP